MAKTKHKKKQKKAKQENGALEEDITLYTTDLAYAALDSAAIAAEESIRDYAIQRYTSENSRRPLFKLAQEIRVEVRTEFTQAILRMSQEA